MKYKRIHNSCKTWTAKVCSMERNAKRMWLLEGEWVEQTHQDRTRLWALPSTVVRKERAENRAGKKSELTGLEESKNNHEDLVKVLFAGWLLFQKLKDSSTNERGFYISPEHTQPCLCYHWEVVYGWGLSAVYHWKSIFSQLESTW